MIRRFVDWLALTSTERTVILFLTLTLLIGAAIRFYEDAHPQDRKFDYTALDSSFAVFSRSTASDSTLDDGGAERRTVNINAATKAELSGLPGVGDVLADRILRKREELGSFGSVADLQKVKGISNKKFEKIRPLVAVQ
jgi:competence ComEA-like helix-hairpin-helix protein